MKKVFKYILVLIIISVLFTSCKNTNESYQVLVPSGTPLLGISEYVVNHKDEVTVTAGSEELIAGWNSNTPDVIIMPINLGAKLYKEHPNYVLYKTYVWGNLYLVSKKDLNNSLESINNKKVIVFGQNSTPDILFKSLVNYYQYNVEIEYVSDVATANALIISGEAEYIISAEPSLTALKNKLTLSMIDLQVEWQKISNNSFPPQAGIFIKKELKDNKEFKKIVLDELLKSVEDSKDIETFSDYAINASVTFSNLGKEIIKQSIPYCHFDISLSKEEEKLSIEFYFNKMIELGLSKQIGGSLPNEEFYY